MKAEKSGNKMREGFKKSEETGENKEEMKKRLLRERERGKYKKRK